MAEGLLNGKSADDPFSNFQFQPPKPMGKYRPYARRNRFRAMAAMKLSQPRGSITGSSQDLLEPAKLMALQEDAKSRRISSEVMKSRLYESVIVPQNRRRKISGMHNSFINNSGEDMLTDEITQYYMHPTRMAMSVPVTPATSTRTTPCGSPTQNRSFLFGMYPRQSEEDMVDGVTPDEKRGLASLFSPQPKYVPAARWTPRVEKEQNKWSAEPILLQAVPKSKKRSPSPMDDGL